MNGDVSLARLDEALIRLRRLWHLPAGPQRAAPGTAVVPDLSTVLVADAVDRQRRHSAAPVRIADVAVRLDVAPSTASRLVDRAARAGVVVRDADRADPRRAALALTPAGKALLDKAFEFRTGYLARVLTGWSEVDVQVLATLLTRFADSVHVHGLPTERTH